MIQRIQNLFLLLSSLGFTGQFFTDFATSNLSIPGMMSDNKYEIQDHIVLIILTVLGILTAIAGIFFFKDRALQLKTTILNLIFSIFLPAMAFFLMYTEKTGVTAGATINDSIGAYLPALPILCAALAMRFIKKDDQLVKSMDRLR